MQVSGRFLASARLIALLTLASRLLGLAREWVFSYLFGASALLSAFRIAFMVPNLARRLFGEGALSSALIPILSEDLQKNDLLSSRRLVGSVLTLLVVVLLGVVVAVEVVIFVWRWFAPDFALDLAALLMPYMVMICATAVAGGVLNVRQHFVAPAAAPVVLNVVIICTGLGGGLWLGLAGEPLMYAIAGGVLVAGVGQLLLVGLALKRVGFVPILNRAWRDPRIKAVFLMMGPMILGLSAVQINTLSDHLIAYWFIETDKGKVGPAVLGYAHYLYQLPLGVFGIALATAIFPVLADRAASGDRAGLAAILGRGVRMSLFVALPATVGLLFVAQPLVVTLFERGAFDAGDSRRVAGTLMCYAVGLPAYFAQHVFVRAFYALQDSRTPARIAARMVVINLAMNLSLVFWLQERGLALATAVCAMLQLLLLVRRFRLLVPEVAWRPLLGGVFRSLLATLLMAAGLAVLAHWDVAGRLIGEHPAVDLATMVIAGICIYAVAARLLRIEELGMVLRRGSRLGDNGKR